MRRDIIRYGPYREDFSDRSLVPIVPISPVRSPVGELATMDPAGAYDILRREIESRNRENELATLSAVLSENSGITRTWLENRAHGETQIEIEQSASEGDTGWFSSGRYLHAKTKVKIS